MGAAFVCVDVVGERKDEFRVSVVPLQGDFGIDAVLFALDEHRGAVHDGLVFVQVLDKGNDAALILELVIFPVALVMNRNQDAAVEKSQLSQTLRERVEAVLDGFKDRRVRHERDLGTPPLGLARDLQVGERVSVYIALLVDLPVPPDFNVETLGKRVDNRYTNAVQPAGNFVAIVVKFPACVQHGEDYFGS